MEPTARVKHPSLIRYLPLIFLPLFITFSLSTFAVLRRRNSSPFIHSNLPSIVRGDIAAPLPITATPTSEVEVALNLWPNIWPRTPFNEEERYLSYTPHSGLHNQRLALINAAVLAAATNRTLIVPPLIFGPGIGWIRRPYLQTHLDQAEKANLEKCRKIKDGKLRKDQCGANWETELASWSWLIDARSLSENVRVIDRTTFDKSWYFTTLGVTANEIKEIPDPYRRSYRIYDDSSTKTIDLVLTDPSAYQGRMNFEDLFAMNDRVIEFGSLFGSGRLKLKRPENRALYDRIRKTMAFKQPLLDAASEALAERMGGRSTYGGLHLRIGGRESSPKFQEGAIKRSSGIFRSLCAQLGLSKSQTDDLLLQNREHSNNPSYQGLPLAPPSEAFHPSPSLRCPYQLYSSDSPLAALNVPIYAATDSRNPRKDPVLALFRNTFPCLIFFDDFRLATNRKGGKRPKDHFKQDRVAEVDFLMDLVVNESDGEKMGGFLGPLAEAETVAKALFVIGTPGSTFSAFAQGTLFESYHSSTIEP